MRTRRIISLTALFSFAVLSYTGIMLFLTPQGRVADWAGWTLWGLSKQQYEGIHASFMILFLVVAIWHVVLNWRVLVGYFKRQTNGVKVFTKEFSAALALTLLFLIGPLTGLPPFKQLLDANSAIKAYWAATEGTPPWGHAEEDSLDRFCRGMEDYERLESGRLIRIDCEDAVAALRAEGLVVDGIGARIKEIAEANGLTPQTLSTIIMEVAKPVTP